MYKLSIEAETEAILPAPLQFVVFSALFPSVGLLPQSHFKVSSLSAPFLDLKEMFMSLEQ